MDALPALLSEQEWNLDGHTTRIIETLQFFASRLPFNFERSFTFKCEENRTSWGIRVKFHKLLWDGSGPCEVAIRRLDNTQIDIGTNFWMRPILPFDFPDLCTNVLTAEGLVPSRQAKKIIRFMPPEALMQLGNRPIQLEVFFRIRRCHSDFQERYPPPPHYPLEKMSVLYYAPKTGTPVEPTKKSSSALDATDTTEDLVPC